MQDDVEPGIAQALRRPKRQSPSGLALMHHINGAGGRRDRFALVAQQLDQALDSNREAAGGSGLAAHLLNQWVITTAAADGSLRAQPGGGPLEDGSVVVIEPAHQTWVQAIRNTKVC